MREGHAFQREKRWEERTYLLKNYHNIVKRTLIDKLSHNAESHLDIACGRFDHQL